MAILTDVQGKILMYKSMKKKSNQTRAGGWILVPKWMMKMKVVFILLVCSLVQVQAAVSARQAKVSIELKNVTLEKIFQELERQNGIIVFSITQGSGDLEEREYQYRESRIRRRWSKTCCLAWECRFLLTIIW